MLIYNNLNVETLQELALERRETQLENLFIETCQLLSE